MNMTKNGYSNERMLLVFLGVWTLINIITASFVELHADEAYYWVYSRFLDWGYFDHPPMVALFIRIGDTLMPGSTLGLRLLTVITSTLSVYLIWKMLSHYAQHIKLFILLFSSVVLFHVYGFITSPDAPLLFFMVLFFYVYQRYVAEDKLKWALLLALVIAGMLYSKYHGILVLFFTILSNLKLLRRPSFWLIVLVSAVVFVPHVLWQVHNNYPSFYYHVIDRSSAYYRFEFTAVYILAQLALAGPLIGWYLYRSAVKVKGTDRFLSAIQFNFYGFFIFFLISTLKGRVEAHWTLPGMLCLFMLAYLSLSKFSIPKWLSRLAVVNIALILLVRLVVMIPIPALMKIKVIGYYFGNKKWAQEVKAKAGDAPVIFVDSFQVPSRYNYYTRSTKGFGYDSRNYRKNQYDIWPLEDSIRNHKAYFIQYHVIAAAKNVDSIPTGIGMSYGFWIDRVRMYQKLVVNPVTVPTDWRKGETKELELLITNPYADTVNLGNTNEEWKCYLEYGFQLGPDLGDFKSTGAKLEGLIVPPHQSVTVKSSVTAPQTAGKYKLIFSVRTEPFSGSRNSNMIAVEIK
jgi:hypothetical protein